MKLKICGITHNFQEVAQLQPHYLGINFWKPSLRYFEGEIPKLPQNIKKVGIFVDAPLEDVLEKVAQYQLEVVQLHGQESPEYCTTLRQKTSLNRATVLSDRFKEDTQVHAHPVEIIKVFSIKTDFDFSVLQAYEAVCDYFLFDTKGKLPGGNGYAFDWSVLEAYSSTKPYFLSGGIGLDNIDMLVAFFQQKASQYCYALDVNSKFETQPGHKCIEKLKEFIDRVSQVRLC